MKTKQLTPCVFPEVGYTPANFRYIMQVCQWNADEAAATLGVARRTICNWTHEAVKGERTGNMPAHRWAAVLDAAEKRLKKISKSA